MSDPSAAIQTAALARLRGDSTLQGLLTGAVSPTWSIYDAMGVPPLKTFPYLVVSLVTLSRGTALSMGQDATDALLQVQGFTQSDQAGGFAKLRGIMAQVYSLMQQQSLSLSGGATNFFLLFDRGQPLPGPDGRTQQYWQRYQLMNVG